MLVLFDHGTPRGLARLLPEHTVITAKARGWDRLSNGELLKMAEAAAVDLLITTDQKIRYQQTLQIGRSRSFFGRFDEMVTRTIAP